MYLNTKQLIEQLTGPNKAWVTRTENTQREKYGNEDVFGVIINKNNDTITIKAIPYTRTLASCSFRIKETANVYTINRMIANITICIYGIQTT